MDTYLVFFATIPAGDSEESPSGMVAKNAGGYFIDIEISFYIHIFTGIVRAITNILLTSSNNFISTSNEE